MQFPFIFLLSSLIWVSLCCLSADGSAEVAKTITVDLAGYGNYSSIQEAINSVPDNNNQWIQIHVKEGIYNEKVYINYTKSHILLEGEGPNKTVIQWGDHVVYGRDKGNNRTLGATNSTMYNATFTVFASNFVARGIGFKNTYNRSNGTGQAVAVLVGGDNSSFYNCRFIGYQDTLCDFQGRHYFNECWIEGVVDFVFGFGQSIYENCTLRVIPDGMGHGWVTAQGRYKDDDPSGFVFKYCTVTGSGKAFLGRAWRPYARVVFYKSVMTDVVVPQGWEAWNAAGQEYLTTFAEDSCEGLGSNTKNRVEWQKKLSSQELTALISPNFIDPEGWRGQQP